MVPPTTVLFRMVQTGTVTCDIMFLDRSELDSRTPYGFFHSTLAQQIETQVSGCSMLQLYQDGYVASAAFRSSCRVQLLGAN